MYTYERFKPGDLIRSTWANKLEDLGVRVSKFYGAVPNVAQLPNAENMEDGHWQIVLEDLSLRIVKNKRWIEYVPRLNIVLDGDIVGTQRQSGSNIVITTSDRTKITGVQVYGDVVGSGRVLDSVLVLNTEIPGKLRQITLSGAVHGTGTVQPDGTVNILANLTGVPEGASVVTTNTDVKSIDAGVDSQKPEPGTAGRIYIQRDTRTIYYDTGKEWRTIAFYPQATVIRETPSQVPPPSFGINYLYTTKNGSLYEVYVANATTEDKANAVVFVPCKDLEIQSHNESLKVAYGFPYYIETFGPDEAPVPGFYVAILIPETIPAQSIMTIYVEKVPGFQPDRAALFGAAPLLRFSRDSEASDEPNWYGTTTSWPILRLVPRHTPRFSTYGIHIEPARQNLLDPWYAKIEYLPVQSDPQTPTMLVTPSGYRDQYAAIRRFSISAHPSMPGYYILTGHKTIYGSLNSIAYTNLNGYVCSYLARQTSTGWSRWLPSVSDVAYYLFAQCEPLPPTSFVFPGMERKAEKLVAPDFVLYSPSGLQIEFETTQTHSMQGVTRPLLHFEGASYKIRVEYTTGSPTVSLHIILLDRMFSASVSSSYAPSYIRVSFYTDNTSKLVVTWANGSTSQATVNLPTSILQLTGALYIGCSPLEGEEQVHAIRHVMFSTNPDHDQRQNGWSIDDPEVLLFYPLRSHTLPTKY